MLYFFKKSIILIISKRERGLMACIDERDTAIRDGAIGEKAVMFPSQDAKKVKRLS